MMFILVTHCGKNFHLKIFHVNILQANFYSMKDCYFSFHTSAVSIKFIFFQDHILLVQSCNTHKHILSTQVVEMHLEAQFLSRIGKVSK
jgi:hypothetical protein